jgi:hypothetical protein
VLVTCLTENRTGRLLLHAVHRENRTGRLLLYAVHRENRTGRLLLYAVHRENRTGRLLLHAVHGENRTGRLLLYAVHRPRSCAISAKTCAQTRNTERSSKLQLQLSPFTLPYCTGQSPSADLQLLRRPGARRKYFWTRGGTLAMKCSGKGCGLLK